ncbi:MAG: carbohydrate ABC transporter permease [Propionibacterium sp.]|nr:carbohydrate ABC transporter permease [Propionibacterium sp.]
MTAVIDALEAPPAPAPRHGRRHLTPAKAVQFVLLLLFACVVLIPLYVVLVTSFKGGADVSASTAWDLPHIFSVDGWASAISRLAPALGRSLVLAISAAVLSSILGSLNGYVFAKWKFPGADIVFTAFLFGMFIPYQAVMIPLQRMLLDLQTHGFGWIDGIPKLILVHTIYGIPICTLIFRNYYATAVPSEILEAARVDGAGMLRIYWSIVLPVSIPGFVVTLIWQFTSAWNFLFALFLTSSRNGPVTYALQELAGGQNPDYPSIMAGVLVASLPTLLVYIALGRYFISGLMSGSVK